MGKTKVILLLGAAVIAGGVVYQLTRVEQDRAVQSLVAEERALNDECRGGSGDDPRTHEACAGRDALAQQLGTRGWCYGTQDQAEYQKQWQKCASDVASQRPPAPSSDEIQFDQNDADKKEMLRQMEAGMADCSNRLVRGLLRQGERSRSKIANYTAVTCGQGLKNFLVMHNVPAGAAEKYAEMIAWKALQNVLE